MMQWGWHVGYQISNHWHRRYICFSRGDGGGGGGVHLYGVCPLNWKNMVSVHTNLAAYSHFNSLNMYDLILLAARPNNVCK